ncbi:MAG: cob(I)yrinic acid a,c-diamide adenosyltransferase [Anaerolineae bacterium]|nr:cob(I)yrinic acid a,c-diamide adenosyltransferase [Anaerolineae bacterium]
MNFYTGNGDDGKTGLLGKGRFSKANERFETLGAIDEASAALGIARSMTRSSRFGEIILQVQRDLYAIMTEVASSSENREQFHSITSEKVNWLEDMIAELSADVIVPQGFIVPGDSQAGAFFDLARSIVRRAERRVVQLRSTGAIDNPELIRYLNRLSSLCFVLELLENVEAGKQIPTMAKE